jgi:tRNA1(Val) A37 N6-methylase TrmN6
MAQQQRPSRSSVERFLRDLGLKARSQKQSVPSWEKDAHEDAFRTEDRARAILSGEYERYSTAIHDYYDLNGFPQNPSVVADLGGGVGVVAMWLAQQLPSSEVRVFDRAKNPLAVGEKWAKARDISNIRFTQASYEELANAATTTDCDFVMLYHALGTYEGGGEDDGAFLYREMPESSAWQVPAETAAAMKVMANMLKPDGVGVVTGTVSERGLRNLFEAARGTDLGVDWNYTVGEKVKDKEEFTLGRNYVFFRRGFPRIAQSAWEEGRAFLANAEWFGSAQQLHAGTLESYSHLFAQGRVLFSVTASYRSGGEERLRLLTSGGLAFLESTSTRGLRRGILHSLAAVMELYKYVSQRIISWQGAGDAVQLADWHVDEGFQRLTERQAAEG